MKDEARIKQTVEAGGGIYRGLLDVKLPNLEPLVLFDDAAAPVKQRSTMAVKVSQLTSERVKVDILEKRAAYSRCSNAS